MLQGFFVRLFLWKEFSFLWDVFVISLFTVSRFCQLERYFVTGSVRLMLNLGRSYLPLDKSAVPC